MMETKKIDKRARDFMTLHNLLIGNVADELKVYGIDAYKLPKDDSNEFLVVCERKDSHFAISCAETALITFAKDAFNIK